MRKYSAGDERSIRTQRLVREWTRSGLLVALQENRMLEDVNVDLRRTNLFLRLILFAFGLLIISASVILFSLTYEIEDEIAIATLCFLAAAGCFGVAELLAGKFRLYRFGVEEAAAVGGVVLAAIGSGFIAAEFAGRSTEFPAFVGLLAAFAAGLLTYFLFGYLYAVVGAMLCLSLAPFQAGISEVASRAVAAVLLACSFLLTRSKRRERGDEFPGDEYGVIQAVALAGVYAFLNLKLFDAFSGGNASPYPGPFYWFTYAMIWSLPLFGLYLGVRDKDRPLLDVSLVLAIATLITNKPYLAAQRQAWDLLAGSLDLSEKPPSSARAAASRTADSPDTTARHLSERLYRPSSLPRIGPSAAASDWRPEN